MNPVNWWQGFWAIMGTIGAWQVLGLIDSVKDYFDALAERTELEVNKLEALNDVEVPDEEYEEGIIDYFASVHSDRFKGFLQRLDAEINARQAEYVKNHPVAEETDKK